MTDEHQKPITVAELIARLQALPQDAYVHTEGCDCSGPCSGARLQAAWPPESGVMLVLLERDDTREQF